MGLFADGASAAHPDPGWTPQLGLARASAARHRQGAQILRGVVLVSSSGQALRAPWEGAGSPRSPPSPSLGLTSFLFCWECWVVLSCLS